MTRELFGGNSICAYLLQLDETRRRYIRKCLAKAARSLCEYKTRLNNGDGLVFLLEQE